MAIARRDMLKSVAAVGLAASAQSAEAREKPAKRTREAHFGLKTPASGHKGLAISGHPAASEIAVDILREGGNACDALLAAALAQTVLEPHLTTVTGCFSMLYYDAATKSSRYLNGNVNAPMAPLEGFSERDVPTGRAVAVPGYWAGFEAAHRELASMPLSRIMKPAIDHAREGVSCGPFLWAEIYSMQTVIGKTEAGRRIFMPERALPNPRRENISA